MNPQPPYAPPWPAPRKSHTALIVSLTVAGTVMLVLVYIVVATVLAPGTPRQPAAAGTVAGRPWAVGTTGGDAYALGHNWGYNWWIAQGSPVPDTSIANSICTGVDHNTLDGAPGTPGPPTAVIPDGGDDQWVSGCVVGLTGK